MKRHSLDPLHFSLLKKLDEFARENGLTLADSEAQDRLLSVLRDSLNQHRNHQARLHGFHVESMFAHVAAAMGGCELITEEDAGAFFDKSGTLRRPDYRIKTCSNEEMLVEVKNFHQKSALRSFRLKGDYLKSLKLYARTFGLSLKIAIYWSRWNLWTLLDADRLDETQDNVEISMKDACLGNEMHLLGDCMLGTIPPLSLRIYANPARPRKLEQDGMVGFTAEKACLCVGGVDIDDEVESRLAWFFMLNGKWTEVEQIAEFNDRNLEYIETRVAPAETPEEIEDEEQGNQPFRMVGYLSDMISRQYLRNTCDGGAVKHLAPVAQPSKLGVLIPDGYQGRALRLWRFIMLPKHTEYVPADDK